MEDSEPNLSYSFPDYKKAVIELVRQTDKVFGLDSGKVKMILSDPLKYFATIKKLNGYIRAKVDDKKLSISDSSMLKDLRKCLEFRVDSLGYRVPLLNNLSG